jgi:hypothetical protein
MEIVFLDEDRAVAFEAKVRKLLEDDDMQVVSETEVRDILASMTPGDPLQATREGDGSATR